MASKKLSFEEALKRIEEIVAILENEEVSLETSVALYKEGLQLSAGCQEKLATAEGEVVLLMEGVKSSWEEKPFLERGSENDF